MPKNVSVIIAAAGMSRRMGSTSSKQLLEINSKSVIEYSLEAFSKSEYVSEIIIVTKSEDIEATRKIASSYPKVTAITLGGVERFDSVKLAFSWVSDNCDLVAIHDAARPLVTTDFINTVIESADLHGAVCPVGRVVDTVKISNDGKTADKTIDRNILFTAQTPQVFKKEIYKNSLEKAKNSNAVFTDDASIVEFSGYDVHLVVNENPNIKITHQGDVELAKLYLKTEEPTIKKSIRKRKKVKKKFT